LATKYTRKKQNYNKKHLAKKLDDLSNKVAKRGVYVIRPANPGFNIVNYIDKEYKKSAIIFISIIMISIFTNTQLKLQK
jgi:hypothetical protein